MNKNLTKKALVPALAMALASVIALTGVTYAWFTTGNTATVGSLDVNVQTANGIQVSLDAKTWKSAITAADIIAAAANPDLEIQYPYGTVDAPVEIAPVSSAGNVTNGKLEMFYGEYNKDGTLKSEPEVEQTRTSGGNFIAFDLYFKTSSDQPLTLKLGDTASYVDYINFGAEDVPEDEKGTDRAVRVAFLPLGSSATPEGVRGLKGTCTPLIWEPNDTLRAPGVDVDTVGTGKKEYKGLAQGFESLDETELAPDKADSANAKTVTTFNADTVIVDLKEGFNKVRVYIWLEGQDVDCINNISNGDFRTNLYFSVPEQEA